MPPASILKADMPHFTRFAVCLLGALGAALPACAQDAPPRHLSELESAGAVFMDDINTPLLHHAATGAPYDLQVLARGDNHTSIERPERKLRNMIEDRNEFVRQEAMPAWSAFVEARVALLRQARSYLIPIELRWQEYDFKRGGYPVALAMNKRASLRSGPTYHCAGAYDTGPRASFKTACLHALNEDRNDPFLRFFPVADVALARRIRDNGGSYLMFAVGEPAGKYRVLRGNEIRYMPLEIFAASGYQPVRITQLILANAEGEIFAISRSNAASAGAALTPATAPARAAPVPAGAALPAGWTLVAENTGAATYIDPASVRREGAIVLYRSLMDFGDISTSPVKSAVALYESDCARRTNRQLRNKGYAGRFGRGGLLDEVREPQAATTPGKGSVGESMFVFACNAATAAH